MTAGHESTTQDNRSRSASEMNPSSGVSAAARRLLGLLLTASVMGACGTAGDVPRLPENATVITGGWLFDGTGDDFVANTGIVIAEGRVERVGVAVELDALGSATRVIQLTDEHYLFPGLFDLHAHYHVNLFGEGRVDETEVYPALFLGNGVTSTFPAGEASLERMRELKARIERGERAGPRIFRSGPYFGSARGDAWSAELTAEQIGQEVDALMAEGVHGFKAKEIGPDQLAALIESAHAHGVTVTGHLGSGDEGSVNPRDAILMGIDRIEHFEGGDAMTPDRPAYSSLVEFTPDMPEYRRIVELYIERGVYFDATLSAYGYTGGRDPEVYDYFVDELKFLTPYARSLVDARGPRRVSTQFERIYRVKRTLIKTFYDMGGGHLITLGTDHPSTGEFFSGFAAHRELLSFVLAGIPPAAALKFATVNAARALKVDDVLGTIEPGKLADIVIVRGNPLLDIRNARNVYRVVKAGEIYDSAELLRSVEGKLGPRGPEEAERWKGPTP